ncbi:MAG: cadherin-like domain-containing protein, partial [Colwellia sp.]|nr:cadherin-like domain-containing protein [Colwellia sp.]
GLALDDAQLVALFATATVVDDSDTLTVSPDLTAFTGSIPAGPHTIQFNSTADSEGLTGSDTMLLTITEASAGNNAPSITSASTVAVTVDVSANHMVTTNDIDGDALTIVTVGSLPAGYALVDNGNGTATVTIVAPSEGAQNITVRVSDGSLSADQVITVNATVAGNNPPTFTNNPPTVATVGSLYSFTPATNDIDGDAVVLTSTTLPSWLTLVGGVLSGTPADGDIGANPVVLSGSDGVDSTPLSFSVLVGNVLPFVFAPLGRVIVFDDSQREKHQDPDAFLDYWCCFSNLIGGDLIVSHQVIVPEGILVDIHSINTIPLTDSDGVVHAVGTVIVLWVSGGSAGTPYKITVRFTTASGRIDDRSIVIHSVDK